MASPERSERRVRLAPPRRRALSQLGLLGVGLAAGALFATSARLDRGRISRRGEDALVGLLREREDRIDDLDGTIRQQRAERDALLEARAAASSPADLAGAEAWVGLEAVRGPGLRVSLADAPASAATRSGVTPDDLVVHQQDLEAYVNALWEGGAEAMMMQDQRVMAGTAYRCVGNTLLLQGRVHSPPFVVSAIGDAQRMTAALDAAPGVARYRQWVERVGLSEGIDEIRELSLPGYEGSLTLTHAEVLDG